MNVTVDRSKTLGERILNAFAATRDSKKINPTKSSAEFTSKSFDLSPRKLTPTNLGLEQISPTGQKNVIAVATLAYRENAVLRNTVEDILVQFAQAMRACIVCICDDGGDDGTPELVSQLVAEYPGQIVAVSHQDQHGRPFNQGYATAYASVLKLAFETGCEKIVTTDADGQFNPADLLKIVEYGETGCYDVVFGRRTHRADGLRRSLVGRAWTLFTRVWTRFWKLKDADCAVKFFRSQVICQFELKGRQGMAGAELVAWSRALNLRIGQFPVRHLPRAAGEQSGNKLSVITGSLKSLPAVYANLYRHGHRLPRLRRLWSPRDVGAYWVTLVAAGVSLAAFAWYYSRGMTLLYPDAVSHLLISHRATASPTPGLAQYGDVWLPGTHMSATLLLNIPGAFFTGIGGSVVSMLAFVVTSRFLYKTVFAITNWLWAGVAAAAIFMFNPNVLYMQSTPMEEVPLYACVAVALFFAVRYEKTRKWQDVAGLSAAAALGSTIRYEGWIIAFALMIYLAAINIFPWKDFNKLKASVVLYAFLPTLFLILWIAYSAAIFGNPLYWLNGPYAKPANWISSQDVAVHHFGIAAQTYWFAMGDTLGWAMLLLLLVSTVAFIYAVFQRRQAGAALILLILPIFFILALELGQRPLHVMEINHNLYNVRFSLIMVIPAAIFVGSALTVIRGIAVRLSGFRSIKPAAGLFTLLTISTLGWALFTTPPTTLAEGQSFASSNIQLANMKAAAVMRQQWHGGYALVQDYGDEIPTFQSHIPLEKIIYEGNNPNRIWQRALLNPARSDVRLIYMRRTPGNSDVVWQTLHASPLLNQYHVVYQDADQLVYSWGQPAPELATKQPAILASGNATWYDSDSDSCLSSLAPIGSQLTVTNPKTSHQVTCFVSGSGPAGPENIINLSSRLFQQLGNLSDGEVSVNMSLMS